jgi:hypothetical protein
VTVKELKFCVELGFLPQGKNTHGIDVFENRVLRRIFRPKTNKVTGDRDDCMRSSSTISPPHQI